MKESKENKKINSLSYCWKLLCWIFIVLIIIYNCYICTLTHNISVLIYYFIISIILSIFIYVFFYTISEILQLLEDIKNK